MVVSSITIGPAIAKAAVDLNTKMDISCEINVGLKKRTNYFSQQHQDTINEELINLNSFCANDNTAYKEPYSVNNYAKLCNFWGEQDKYKVSMIDKNWYLKEVPNFSSAFQNYKGAPKGMQGIAANKNNVYFFLNDNKDDEKNQIYKYNISMKTLEPLTIANSAKKTLKVLFF
ncbi:MAG: hypothetical protein U0K68_01860 [Agathobacter sp.]|nr:hypothetical protein [Agathobacter sp.]